MNKSVVIGLFVVGIIVLGVLLFRSSPQDFKDEATTICAEANKFAGHASPQECNVRQEVHGSVPVGYRVAFPDGSSYYKLIGGGWSVYNSSLEK